MPTTYRLVSADGHLEQPLERWVARVPAKYLDRAPRHIKLPDGTDAVLVEGRPLMFGGMSLFGGKDPETFSLAGLNWESTAGTGPPEQRLREQDADGVDAEVLYPGFGSPQVCRSIRDTKAYLAMNRAYNDYLAEEYCAVAPDRLIGVGLIPETGLEDAVTELEHCARAGLKTVNLAAFPSGKAYPTPEDDRFWAAALDLQMPLTAHKSFDKLPSRGGEPAYRYPRQPAEDYGWNYVERMARYGLRGALNVVQLIVAGVFERFPGLKIYWAENQVGWIPIYLEQMDHTYELHRYWADSLFGVKPLSRMPSEYARANNYWGFFNDPIGIRLRHAVGADRIMWGGDFPHAESPWPNSRPLLEQQMADVPEDEKHAMLAGNAVEFFRLDGAASPGPRDRGARTPAATAG